MIKKIGWVGAMAVVGAVLMALTANVAAAAATTTQSTVVNIGAAGKVTIRGTIDAIAGQVLTVKSWGGDWNVNVSAGTQILPDLTGNDFANFQVGDYVGAQGTVNQTANWTVDATLVRDWTYKQTAAIDQKQNRTTASQTMKSNTPKNYVGVASGIGDGSFTLMVDGEADIVNVDPGAQIVNRNWLGIPLSALSEGDNVRVWGINASGTIAVDIVRDVSLPATTTVVAQ